MAETLVLLGRDHPQLGDLQVRHSADGRAAIALCAGSDPESPARWAKGDPACPNEDAVLCIVDGRRALLAVANAHFGPEASETLIRGLAGGGLPSSTLELRARLDALVRSRAASSESATTLCAVLVDRAGASAQGFSVGDSTCAVLRRGSPAGPRNPKASSYVSLGDPEGLTEGRWFGFDLEPGDLLVCFTDGVDECCYGQPERSIGPAHLATLLDDVGPEPTRFVHALAELALRGVDGQPGGQDNLAIAALRP
ncbi:MAG: SpoIIE family protein phosphatase [Planctomycetes bacterium]|nr:SpoIIE family protein phosphatase [Planctomycetota bacterium]